MGLGRLTRAVRVGGYAVRGAAAIVGQTVVGNRVARDVRVIHECIDLQNRLAKTPAYWRIVEASLRRRLPTYHAYMTTRHADDLRRTALTVGAQIDRVLNAHRDEFLPYADVNAAWVMSTGRVGVDALDRLLKTSPELFSIHREFKGEAFYENDSAVTTKSLVFNRLLRGEATDDELLQMTRRYLAVRLKTIARAGGRRLVFCEHHDEAWLPILVRVFPRSRIIHLYRSAADTMQSYLAKGLYSDRQVVPLELSAGHRLEFVSLFALVAWFCAFVNAYIAVHKAQIDPARVLDIRSAELLRQDPATLERLRQFLEATIRADDYTRILSQRHNTKAGGESAFPQNGTWPGVFTEVTEIFGQAMPRELTDTM